MAVMDEDNKIQVIMEVHKHISVVNVYCDIGINFDSARFQVSDNALAIRLSGRPTIYSLKLTTIENFFLPSSFFNQHGNFSKFRKIDEMVEATYETLYDLPVFRVQVNASELFLASNLANLTLDSLPNHTLKMNLPYYITCSTCHHVLVDNCISFTKIASLPFDLTELYENLFCHKMAPEREVKIISQPTNEMFMTSTCYVLSCFKDDALTDDPHVKALRCTNCSALICNTKRKNISRFENSVFCFKDKISFVTSMELNRCSDEDRINVAIRSLLTVIQETLKTSLMCKLYLEAKMPQLENDCLLIWVVDQNMKRYVSTHSFSPDHNSSVEENVEFASVVKVMYYITNSASDLARAWIYDFSVDFHHISDTMLTNISNYLQNSSCNMPRVSGYPSDFSIGYIPLKL